MENSGNHSISSIESGIYSKKRKECHGNRRNGRQLQIRGRRLEIPATSSSSGGFTKVGENYPPPIFLSPHDEPHQYPPNGMVNFENPGTPVSYSQMLMMSCFERGQGSRANYMLNMYEQQNVVNPLPNSEQDVVKVPNPNPLTIVSPFKKGNPTMFFDSPRSVLVPTINNASMNNPKVDRKGKGKAEPQFNPSPNFLANQNVTPTSPDCLNRPAYDIGNSFHRMVAFEGVRNNLNPPLHMFRPIPFVNFIMSSAKPTDKGYYYGAPSNTTFEHAIRLYAGLLKYEEEHLTLFYKGGVLDTKLTIEAAGVKEGERIIVVGKNPNVNTDLSVRRVRFRECTRLKNKTYFEVSPEIEVEELITKWANYIGVDPDSIVIIRENKTFGRHGSIAESGIVNEDKLFSCSVDIVTHLISHQYHCCCHCGGLMG